MLHKAALCLPGFDDTVQRPFRLGILGFGTRARDYIARAVAAQNENNSGLEIIVFVSPESAEWAAARSATGKNKNLTICTSMVTAILPNGEVKSTEAQFIIETAQGSYPVNDLFLNQSGGALNPRRSEKNFGRDQHKNIL